MLDKDNKGLRIKSAMTGGLSKKDSSKIKLLYALESAGGGTLKHVVYLSTKLDRNLYDVTVVLPDENYERDTPKAVLLMKQKGIHVEVIDMKKRLSPIQDISALIKIRSLITKQQFDIIHIHSSKAGALFRIAAFLVKKRSVVIYTPHCFNFTSHTGFLRRMYSWMESLLASITDHIVVSGVEQTVLYKEEVIPVEKISVINNAIYGDDYKKMNRIEMLKSWNIPSHHQVIVGVGRLVKQKNWDLFLQTAALVLKHQQAVTFLIAGDGPLYHHLAKMIDQLGITAHVKLCGYVEDISQVYSVADIFLSTSRWEGLPHTYLEALHFGIPMLISSTEGMLYFFNLTDAIPIPLDNSNRICEKILEALSNAEKKEKNNQSDLFSFPDFMDLHDELYRSIR